MFNEESTGDIIGTVEEMDYLSHKLVELDQCSAFM